MASSYQNKPDKPKPAGPWNPTTRSIITVLLVMHFTCVFVVLASNNGRSPLQNRLVRIFGFYTQLLNFDPDSTPYSLTYGEQTDDVVFVVDLYADGDKPVSAQKLLKSVTLPDRGSKLLDEQKRYFKIGRIMALGSDPQNPQDDTTGEIARAFGKRIMEENDARRCVIHCIRRRSQPMNLEEMGTGFKRDDATDRSYDVMIYEADVWLDEDNQVQAIKRSAVNEVAPRQGGS
ncbi:hypothetical protein [Anatilimnocola floriformis]|uniref:hypothetical protein n=1 Tax=Anatilimnocola floriformis TaxID=2948575 RepID=UPI0020C2573A|nr:hypothetical protein [Anatilimnocola floriformis]